MIKKNCFALILLVLLLSAFRAYAENTFPGTQSDEPIEITSDRMEAFNDQKLVVFSGHATVAQGTSVLKADKLFLYYKNEPGNKDTIGTIETDKTGDLERIEAKGNVSLTQGERVARGEEAVYFRETSKVIMTGNAVLNEGKNSIKGDRVIIFLNENRGIVESGTQKQVKAIIYPQNRNKTRIK
ncbi:MAG: lipopolysaccharide transport periplasmic protein LptA [Smithella sp.]|jgi:lipopolysaccharide export system protein LptA